MRVIVSLSPPTPENPFSISSIQRMQGAAASAIRMAFRRFASLSPTYLPIMLPISSFKSGDSNRAAEALAHKDFPQPGIPTINTPLGMATPYLRASAICLITCALLVRYFFSASIPPMLFKFSGVSINSNRPDFFTICFLLSACRSLVLRCPAYSCLMFFTGFSLLAIQLCTATAAKLISITITPAATIHGHHTMR